MNENDKPSGDQASAPSSLRQFVKVSVKYPPPHERYVVIRNSDVFTATPCYGMHNPWWVVQTMEREVDPVKIEPEDSWLRLVDFHLASRGQVPSETLEAAPSAPQETLRLAVDMVRKHADGIRRQYGPIADSMLLDSLEIVCLATLSPSAQQEPPKDPQPCPHS